MPFVPFHEFCPEVARRETRTITVPPGSDCDVPPTDYGFVEMFCDEPGCDCRRVMFYVTSLARRDVEAVIAWGWENVAFYEKWFGSMSDRRLAREMQGPCLNFGSPETENSPAILRLAQHVLLNDPAYVARIRRHYALFRQQVSEGVRSKLQPGRDRSKTRKKLKERWRSERH